MLVNRFLKRLSTLTSRQCNDCNGANMWILQTLWISMSKLEVTSNLLQICHCYAQLDILQWKSTSTLVYIFTLWKWIIQFKVHFTPLTPLSAPRTTSRTDPRRRINSSCSELSTPASSWRWAVTARPLRCQVRVLHQTCHSQCVTSVPSMWVSV